jgi:site-specific recombinase XerC
LESNGRGASDRWAKRSGISIGTTTEFTHTTIRRDDWRYVYFPTKVRSKLKLWLKERQNLQIKGRELFPFSEKTCGRILRRWCGKVSFQHAEKVGTHWCRHSFIRLSRRVGRNLKAVQQNTGDSIKTILEWYDALSPEDMAKELDKKPIVSCPR